MATLVMAAAYFACTHLGRQLRLAVLLKRVYRAAKRFYGIPEFRFYAIADGLKNILYGRGGKLAAQPPLIRLHYQCFPSAPEKWGRSRDSAALDKGRPFSIESFAPYGRIVL